MHIERILHSQGFGSRKICRALIRAGRVTISGQVQDNPFADLPTEDLVFTVDRETWRFRDEAYVMLHKPSGYECSRQPQFHAPVFALLPEPLVNRGVQPIGRLDQDTTGLLLLSDDGQFIHVWSSGRKRVPKIYEVVVRHPVSETMTSALLAGVQLHDDPAPVAAAACERTGERSLKLTITEGKYHQVKRMVAAAGNRVESLHRSGIGGLRLPDDLAPGQWRWLDDGDLARLADFDTTTD
ncbi:16S rRNA pseudouridine(516) synthase [Aromatoleum buckelii]|uniref:Pseudouridine synthase n=1 Tax=Aromatoleum buckelii TaxID=200254 RepID=A0ABX1N251_9RHOO|nr:16S rRNA pseudouridine(516) synthase [Aromatoleum buckelii]MCK0510092.1 16S rRNA pseudouridine(516) synthase [Aromatoleum buckelii]